LKCSFPTAVIPVTAVFASLIIPQEKSFPRERRQKEKRYVQLLSGEPELDVFAASPAPTLESVSDMSRAQMLLVCPFAALFIVIRSHSACAIVADGFDRTSFHGFLAKRLLLRVVGCLNT
jgi:hypothetical protein